LEASGAGVSFTRRNSTPLRIHCLQKETKIMMDYRRRMRTRMLEATRLTRTRQLLKATALIQRTLRDALKSKPSSDTTDQPSEPVIEGSFRVVEPDVAPEQPAAGEPDLQEVEVIIMAPPTPDRAGDSPAQKQATSQPVSPPSPAPPNQKASPGQHTETSPMVSEFPLPLRLPRHLWRWRDKLSTPQPTSGPPQTGESSQDNGRFLEASYTNEAGTRSYKLYVPGGYHGQALPLVVMLHGCTQSPDDFATATRMNEFAETHTFFVAYPAQTLKANVGKCWNWFKTSEQQRDRGEPAIIAGLTRQLIDTYNLDTSRVYVVGISAGGAMAMVMGMTYPDLYAATGIQSGVAYGVAHNIPSGLAVIKKGGGSASAGRLASATGGQAKPRVVPTIVFHGDHDSIVHPSNSDQIIAQWTKLRAERGNGEPALQVTVQRGQAPAGHAYTRSLYHDGSGPALMEQWLVHGAGHAWSGGNPDVSWTDAKGPDATQEMLRFFYEHPHPEA
jgi:poly(hydroxyalkanoate) depolymerase family esterase